MLNHLPMKHFSVFLFIAFFPLLLSSQPLTPIIDSVPMRDGRKLPVDIFLPAGWTSGPVILIQTPYNRVWFRFGMPLGIGVNLNSSNYAFVTADWRGFYGGMQANYTGAPSRGEDGYDIVEWIATQSWSNDTIGAWGPSALGKVQFQTAKEHPPHLTCICPLVAAPQFEYEEYFPGGCYRTEYVEQLDGLGYGMSPFLLSYPVHSNLWTFGVENPNFYPDSIAVPAFMIGGWYDHNITLMLDFFNAIRTQSPANVQNQHRLLMGPWAHGGNGSASVGSAQQGELFYNNAESWNDSLALLFFDYHLRGINNGWNATPTIQYYTMGSNTWNSAATWPPVMQNVTLYMHTDTTMDNIAPVTSAGSISYLYDPNDPSPTVGGPTLRQDLDQGPFDQSDSVESRSDILTFTTAPLAQDMTITGSVVVHLEVSSDKFDTDFCVRMCDVYPTGESMLINDGVYRMRFRNGFDATDTANMIPGTHYFIDIELPATSITILQGHQLRIDVTSSNYPRFNRNMNTGQEMYPAPLSTAGDTLVNPQVATNTVYTNSVYPSRVIIPCNTWPNGMTAQPAAPAIAVHPNPASAQQDRFISITTDGTTTNLITLCDAQGKVVMQMQSAAPVTKLDVSSLGPGLYLLNVTNDAGTSSQKVLMGR